MTHIDDYGTRQPSPSRTPVPSAPDAVAPGSKMPHDAGRHRKAGAGGMMVCALALAIGLPAAGPAGDAGLSQLTDPRGLEDPLLRWNAQLVAPVGTAVPPGLENPEELWDFRDGSFDGITRFSDGILNPRIEDGALAFSVGEDALFYWGDHEYEPGVAGLQIGADWEVNSLERWRNWAVVVRLKQSLPESEWTISARRAGGRPQMDQETVTVEGTEWQEITVRFGYGRSGAGGSAFRRHSVAIAPQGPGNDVRIDWVKVVRLERRLYLRKTLVLDQPVRVAEICFAPIFNPTLYVNGRQVYEGYANGVSPIDIAPYLRVGENVIAYEDDAVSPAPPPVREAALEGFLLMQDGSFQRFYTDETWKGALTYAPGWNQVGFDDTDWAPVQAGHNLAQSIRTLQRITDQEGRPRARGWGTFLDPPYFGPIGLRYPDKTTPDDTPAFFPVADGARIRLTLPEQRPEGVYTLEYRLYDAFNEELLEEGTLPRAGSEEGYHVYEMTVRRPDPGVYNLVATATLDGQILDRRFEEFAFIGRIPQREVPWQEVDREMRKNLIAEVDCGDPNAPFEYIEHPGRSYRSGMEPPAEPMTRIEEKDGRAYRVLSDGYGDWVAWKIPMPNPHRPHLLVVEYPDDRPQNFNAYARDRTGHYNADFGTQESRRGSVWCLNDPDLLPLTGDIKQASFIFYPQSTYPYLSVELMNLFADGQRPAVYRIRVYEIEDLPAPEIPHRQEGRWFGSQTERGPAVVASTYYNGFFHGGDAKLFANIYRCRKVRHYGFVRDWYITFANMIRRMRHAGENMFMSCFWMYTEPYWPSAALGRAAWDMQYHDNHALWFAMFEANDMRLLPYIEYINSERLTELNRYTDKEVAEGAPTPLVVTRTGQQATLHGAGASPWNVGDPRVLQDLKDIIREIGARYGHFESFQGIAFAAGGACLPTLYNHPEARDWLENLEWGWEDATVRRFTETTGIEIPVAFDDPERFARRYDWVMANARPQWIEFRQHLLTSVHLELAEAIRALSPDARYYPFLVIPSEAFNRAVVMQNRDLYEALLETGNDVVRLKEAPNVSLGYKYRPESMGMVNQYARGLSRTFNTLERVSAVLDQGDRTACFIDPLWQEPDYGNFLYRDWVWRGGTQNNPSPLFSGLHYPKTFADRLSLMTPGVLAFCMTDGLAYTAQNDARRPFGVAYQSIPPGDYTRLEGRGLDRNLVIRESVDGGLRSFYVVNPAWWDVRATLHLSGPAPVTDLVNDTILEGDALPLDLGPYEVRVFRMPRESELAGAESEVCASGAAWMREQLEIMEYIDHLGVQATLRLFSMPEPLEISVMRVGHLRRLAESGDALGAQRLLHQPWMIRLVGFLEEKRRVDAAGGVETSDVYRINVGGSEPYTDSLGRTWLPDRDFNYGVVSYGYLDSEPGRVVFRGGDREVAGTDDPEIYRSERYGHSGHGFLVPDGEYTVRIHYAEMFRHRPHMPSTDSGILINGRLAYPGFNLANEVGGAGIALVRTVTGVRPRYGRIEIRFAEAYPGLRYQGIEIIREE